MNLLTTFTHHSELQVITAPPLITTLYKSPQHLLSLFPACCVLTSHFLATAYNSGDSSASRAQVLLSQPPVLSSFQFPQSQLTTINSGTLNPILCCNCQLSRCHLFSIINSPVLWCSLYSLGAETIENTVSNNSSIVICLFVAAGTC
jgi:hypothetical protein